MSMRHPLDFYEGSDDDEQIDSSRSAAKGASLSPASKAPAPSSISTRSTTETLDDRTRQSTDNATVNTQSDDTNSISTSTAASGGIGVLDLSSFVSSGPSTSLSSGQRSLSDRLNRIVGKPGSAPGDAKKTTSSSNSGSPPKKPAGTDGQRTIQMIPAEDLLGSNDDVSPSDSFGREGNDKRTPSRTSIDDPLQGNNSDTPRIQDASTASAAQLATATVALSRDLYKLGMSYLRRDPNAAEVVELDLAGIFDRYPEIAEDPAFHDFVDLARRPEAGPLVRTINDFVYELQIQPKNTLSPLRASERIQRAMEFWESDPLFAPAEDHTNDDPALSAFQGLESYLYSKLKPHQSQATLEDRQRDEALQFRVSLLNAAGLSLNDLGISDKHEDAVLKMVKYGGFELLKIDMIATPRLRMRAIVNFHKAAIELISAFLNSDDGKPDPSPTASKAFAEHLPVGGDVALPALIWVILRVNPPRLASNLAMLGRFRYVGFLTGEEGFAFTNLSAAVSFLGSADLTLFGVPPQLAERYPPRDDQHTIVLDPSPPATKAASPVPPAPVEEKEVKQEATKVEVVEKPAFEPMEREVTKKSSSWTRGLLGSKR